MSRATKQFDHWVRVDAARQADGMWIAHWSVYETEAKAERAVLADAIVAGSSTAFSNEACALFQGGQQAYREALRLADD